MKTNSTRSTKLLIFLLSLNLVACSEQSKDNQRTENKKSFEIIDSIDSRHKITEPSQKQSITKNETETSFRFVQLSIDELAKTLSVESSRIYALFEFNRPSVVLNLPKIENSAFARVSFDQPKMLDTNNSEIEYEIIRGLYDPEEFSTSIRFATLGFDEKLIEFSRVVGTIKVDFPLLMSVEKFETSGEKRGIKVSMNEDSIEVTGDFENVAGKAGFFLQRSAIIAFNDKGELLEPLPNQPTWEIEGKVRLSFNQPPSEVHVAFSDMIHTLKVPYDLEPSRLLPESTMGRKPK